MSPAVPLVAPNAPSCPTSAWTMESSVCVPEVAIVVAVTVWVPSLTGTVQVSPLWTVAALAGRRAMPWVQRRTGVPLTVAWPAPGSRETAIPMLKTPPAILVT